MLPYNLSAASATSGLEFHSRKVVYATVISVYVERVKKYVSYVSTRGTRYKAAESEIHKGI